MRAAILVLALALAPAAAWAAFQALVPASNFSNETGSFQTLVPGGVFLNETAGGVKRLPVLGAG